MRPELGLDICTIWFLGVSKNHTRRWCAPGKKAGRPVKVNLPMTRWS